MVDVCEFGQLGPDDWSDDAVWIITSSFMVYTMQSGFALLTAGWVSRKNEIAVMMKVATNVIFCGFGYWVYGFGLTYGSTFINNPYFGLGCLFVKAKNDQIMGRVYAPYLFQLSLVLASASIMSSAIPERCKFIPFCIFSLFYPFIYSVPAGWLWTKDGFLRNLGAFDLAGAGPVHLVGAVSGGVASYLLGPTLQFMENKREKNKSKHRENHILGSPMSAILGFLMLWWGWLGMNCGSTFGISGKKWKYAARAAGSTINASVSGGAFGLVYSFFRYKRVYSVPTLMKAMVASLVSVTAGSVVIHPWESIFIGTIGSMIAVLSSAVVARLGIDDPVGAISSHGVCAVWGILAVGLFAHKDDVLDLTQGLGGLIHTGDFTLLGVQSLLAVCCALWAAVTSFICLYPLHKIMGLRVSAEEEKIGLNLHDHDVDTDTGHDTTFEPPNRYIHPFKTKASLRSVIQFFKKQVKKRSS
ncbi:putative ammonium transporter 3 [Nymphon striatum]|nr:putative ammonium transporter 3 [Nymphon striatum]